MARILILAMLAIMVFSTTARADQSPFETSFVWYLVLWAPLPYPTVGHNNHPAYYARFQTEERCEAVTKLLVKTQPRGTKLECQDLSATDWPAYPEH